MAFAGAASIGASLALASSAWGDNFWVDPSGSNSNACTSPGAGACQNLAGALVKTRATGGGDTINVAAGTYDVTVLNLDQASDDGTNIVGAGPSATIIRKQSGTGDFGEINVGSPTQSPSVQLRDLKIEQDAAGGALSIWTTTGLLSDVAIVLSNASNSDTAVALTTGHMTFDAVSISGAWTGGGIAGSQNVAIDMNDSTVTTNGIGIPLGITSPAPSTATLNVDRSVLAARPTSSLWAIGTTNANVTIDSSLLTGGTTGIIASASGEDHSATLRNVTIDSGNPGTADPFHNGVWADSSTAGDLMPISLDSSVVLEQQKVDSGGGVTCTNSDVQDQTASGIACGSGGGNASSAPVDLFVDAAGGDYHLKATPLSPAIDTGSTAALAGDESTTDLDGSARAIDGSFDCTVRRDKGAYESPAATASISGADNALLGDPVPFSGQVSVVSPDVLTFDWTFSDGGSSSSQNASHAFTALGAQQAALKVSDPHGCFVTATHPITIAPQPQPGPGGPAPPIVPPQPPTSSHVVFKLGGSRKQKLGRFVAVSVVCPATSCSATASGTLNVPGTAKRFKLKKLKRSLQSGHSAKLKLGLPKSARKAAAHALRKHRKVNARISVTVSGGSAAATRVVALHL